MKYLSILGSTGSIGRSTLDVVRIHNNELKVFALSCNSNIDLLSIQAQEFKPKFIVCSNENDARILTNKLSNNINTKVLCSPSANSYIASHPDVTHVLAAISGSAGLKSTFDAVRSGKEILLANKESMVMAGPIINKELKKNKSKIIPIDSEHNAIFQVLNLSNKDFLKKIILTASGGPFLDTKINELGEVTLNQALNHPNWKMGEKVTIDSATMMNKGLEIIEASYLFHPQSIIHSFVEFIDGSLLTQLGYPDMKIPISYALGYPKRINSGIDGINLSNLSLEFFDPDLEKFPCLGIAYKALESGHNFCIALNAANEIAVKLFLEQKIKFIDIFSINSDVLSKITKIQINSIESILEYDLEVREITKEIVKKYIF
jgi:1-deoxy-D-xylulose-5-phosphate reductoisomerase